MTSPPRQDPTHSALILAEKALAPLARFAGKFNESAHANSWEIHHSSRGLITLGDLRETVAALTAIQSALRNHGQEAPPRLRIDELGEETSMDSPQPSPEEAPRGIACGAGLSLSERKEAARIVGGLISQPSPEKAPAPAGETRVHHAPPSLDGGGLGALEWTVEAIRSHPLEWHKDLRTVEAVGRFLPTLVTEFKWICRATGYTRHHHYVGPTEALFLLPSAPTAADTGETQATISKWCEDTFGAASSNARVASRANEEMAELLKALTRNDSDADAIEEAADIVIILYRLAARMGINLHSEIDRKMAVNRARKWNVGPDGHGYHVKDAPLLSEDGRAA